MNFLCVVRGRGANYSLRMKHALISAALIDLVACSPSTNAAPQEAAVTAALPKTGNWTVLPAESHIKFTAVQTGDTFTGEFTAFDAVINFDPAALKDASVTAAIDMNSFEAGDEERNGALPSKDWFFVKSYPKAVFQSDNFTNGTDNNYQAFGTLSLKGVTQPLTLPFNLEIDGDRAVMSGSVSLNRGDYKVGQGAWATDEWVSLDVKLDVKVTATRN